MCSFNRLPTFLLCLIWVGAACNVTSAEKIAPLAASRPNIILVMTDDTSPAEYSCYATDAYPAANKTPFIDQMASEGIRFDSCWATPVCTSTRAMLLTGKFGSRTGVYGLGIRHVSRGFAAKHTPISKHLADAGYATAFSGKWHLPGSPAQPTYGFDTYSALGGYLNTSGPNVQWDGDWFSWDKPAEQIQGSGVIGKRHGWYPSLYWNGCVVEDGQVVPSDADTYGPDLNQAFVLDFIDDQTSDQPFFVYYASVLTHMPWVETPSVDDPSVRVGPGIKPQVALVDKHMRQLVERLKRKGLYENTIIFFCSDNPTQGYGKEAFSEFGARVPLIVCGGPIAARRPSTALVSLADFFPTFVELATGSKQQDETIDGVSMLGVLEGDTDSAREWCFSFCDYARMIRTQSHSLDGRGGVWKTHPSGDMRDYEPLSENAQTAAIRQRLTALMAHLPEPTIPVEKARRARWSKWDGPPTIDQNTLRLIRWGNDWMNDPRRLEP